MPSNQQVADVLDAAAELYESEKYDWCQGSAVSDDGLGVCASQALCLVTGMTIVLPEGEIAPAWATVRYNLDRFDRDLYEAAVYALAPVTKTQGIVGWNDSGPERTKQQVIDLFKDTAKELRNGNEG